MRLMILASLLLNVAVLIPVCSGLVTNARWTQAAYGDATPARGVLLSVYAAILVLSLLLLSRPDPKMVAALLLVQIVYKVTTPITVGTVMHPVVISNLLIAVVHALTVWLIWRARLG